MSDPRPRAATAEPPRPARVSRLAAGLALGTDAALILLFAGLGRGSHSLGQTLLGLIETAWPFLVGMLLVWGWGMVWRRPVALLRSGVPVWLGAVGIGLLLRVVAGGTAAPAFAIVTVITLGAFLLGWRGIAALVIHMRRR